MQIKVMPKKELQELKPGELVERSLGGVPVLHRVKEIREGIIVLVPDRSQEEVDRDCLKAAERLGLPKEMVPLGVMPEWTFNRETGLEIDESLGWDGLSVTGSAITRKIDEHVENQKEEA